MQAGFARYGEERILYRSPEHACRSRPMAADRPPSRASARRRRSTPTSWTGCTARPRRRRSRDWRTTAFPTGSARVRTGACHARRSRRSCVSPTSRRSSRKRGAERDRERCSASARSAWPRRTSRTTCESSAAPDHDPSDLIDYGMGVIAERHASAGQIARAIAAIGARRRQRRADLRIAARSASRGARLRDRGQRVAADEGDGRSRVRAGARRRGTP